MITFDAIPQLRVGVRTALGGDQPQRSDFGERAGYSSGAGMNVALDMDCARDAAGRRFVKTAAVGGGPAQSTLGIC